MGKESVCWPFKHLSPEESYSVFDMHMHMCLVSCLTDRESNHNPPPLCSSFGPDRPIIRCLTWPRGVSNDMHNPRRTPEQEQRRGEIPATICKSLASCERLGRNSSKRDCRISIRARLQISCSQAHEHQRNDHPRFQLTYTVRYSVAQLKVRRRPTSTRLVTLPPELN